MAPWCIIETYGLPGADCKSARILTGTLDVVHCVPDSRRDSSAIVGSGRLHRGAAG